MFDLQVVAGDPFTEIVKDQFMKRFGVEVIAADHFSLVRRFLGFDQHPGQAL